MDQYEDDNSQIRQLLVRLEASIGSHDTATLHQLLAPYVNLDMSALKEGDAGTRPCETVIQGWLEGIFSRPHQLHAFQIRHDKDSWSRVSARGHAVRGCEGCDHEGRWDFVLRHDEGQWRINRYRFVPGGE